MTDNYTRAIKFQRQQVCLSTLDATVRRHTQKSQPCRKRTVGPHSHWKWVRT